MENEIWKDIPNYERLYQVSNFGNIKKLSNNKTIKEKILKPLITKYGYLYVGLYKNKKVKNTKIHILVAITFLKYIPSENLMEINHKDNNRSNNKLDNLEVLSQKERTIKIYENRIKHKSFIGTIIGKVEIIEFDKFEKGNGRNIYFYKYKCICGNIETAPKHSLLQSKKSRNTYCCSTCRKNKLSEWSKTACVRYKDPIEGKCSTLISNYKSKAKRKKWEFKLTFAEFKDLVTSNCHYCNLEPNKCRIDNSKSRQGISRVYFNGVDRVDSSKGYVLNNVVSCCEDCNKAKRNLSYKQFIDLITRIYNNMNSMKC